MFQVSSSRGAVAAQSAQLQTQVRSLQSASQRAASQSIPLTFAQPHATLADELVGLTFRTIRHDLGISQATLARRVGASVTTIEALEAGVVRGLPGWSELSRIIAAYAAMLHTDLSPIENRLRWYFDQADAGDRMALTHDGSRQPVSSNRTGMRAKPPAAEREPRRKKRAWRQLLTLGIPLLTALGVATTAHTSPQALFAVADTMPVSMRSIAQAGLAMITPVKSYRAEGLTWIEAADPRSRKSDRLKAR